MSKAEDINNEKVPDQNNIPDSKPEPTDVMVVDTEMQGADADTEAKITTQGEGDEAKADVQNYTFNLRRDSADEEKDIAPGGSTKTISTTHSNNAPNKVASVGGFKIRPDLSEKFRPGVVQAVIERTLKEFLEGRPYSAEDSPQWTKSITNAIHAKVRGLDYKRYKIVTFVVLGEYRGGGISVSNRCLWDADSDCKATYKFINDSLFCVGSVYGFYFY